MLPKYVLDLTALDFLHFCRDWSCNKNWKGCKTTVLNIPVMSIIQHSILAVNTGFCNYLWYPCSWSLLQLKKHWTQPLHALSSSAVLPTPVSFNFFKCQLTGVRNATSYPGTDVCITVILSWQSSLQHKYHGVWALGACGVYNYAVKISSLG